MNAIRSALVGLITLEARLALALHGPKVIAVTGNLGKTTTKDAIFTVMQLKFRTRKSMKSFNSDIGVPLAILGLANPWSNPVRWIWTLVCGLFCALSPRFPELLVLEVGADARGDISKISKWLRPDVAVYTGVPEIPVHIANFNSRDELVNEKRELLLHIKPGGRAVVIDTDREEAVRGVAATALTYGFDPSASVAASNVHITMESGKLAGMAAEVHSHQSVTHLRVQGTLGKPVVLAALAAIAVAKTFGIDPEQTVQAIGKWSPAPGRMRILKGCNDSTLIDDSYNASPAATLAALSMLSEIPAKRKIAVLGDMRELGGFSERAHREVGAKAAGVADILVTVGEESKVLAQAARDAGMTPEQVRQYGYDTSAQVGKDLARELLPGDTVLLKGSQNRIRLERAVYELLAEKSQAQELLVRFDPVWRDKA